MKTRLVMPAVALALLFALPVFAQETDDPTDGFDDEGEMSLEEISRMLDNPVGNLWIIFMENDVAGFKGRPADGWETVNTLIVQPILPVGLTEDWNLITRPIIPSVSAPKFTSFQRRYRRVRLAPARSAWGVRPAAAASRGRWSAAR